MKNALTGLGALALAVAIPASALAATYQYVNVSGVLKTEEASSAAQALLVSDIAPHSGVILADGSAGVDAENGAVVGTGSTNTSTTVSSTARSMIITNADGSVTVMVPAGTHVHSDSDTDTSMSSNNGSCSQVITTSEDTTVTSSTTDNGSNVHIEHDTPDTNC